MARVVVTADDFGLSPGVNRGILAAHQAGIVTSTTWMATLPESLAAAGELREWPSLDVGIHLDLTCGAPCAPIDGVRSLVGPDGAFLGLGQLMSRAMIGRVGSREVRREWAAQIERGIQGGLTFSFLTSHQHVHMFPAWLPVANALASQFRIPFVRFSRFRPVRTLRDVLLELCAMANQSRAATPGIPCVTSSVAFIRWARSSSAMPPLAEVITHPGEIDDVLKSRDPLWEPRETDLRMLSDPELHAALERRSIALTTFRDLGSERVRAVSE